MSDFLRSLVARQLGAAEPVRPRLAGRFEPPPDAFAPEAFPRAEAWDATDAEPLELSVEVEARPARERDAATPRVGPEAPRAHAPRPEPSDSHERVVFVEAPREEPRTPPSRERSPAQAAEPAREAAPDARRVERPDAQGTPAPPARDEARAHARAVEEGAAPVRPKSVVPAHVEEDARGADEVAREARAHTGPGVEGAAPFKPAARASERESEGDEGPREQVGNQAVSPADEAPRHAPLVIRARARGERREPPAPEPREPSRRMFDDAERPAAGVTPAQTSPPAPLGDAGAKRASEAPAALKRVEPARTDEPARAFEGAADSLAPRRTRRVGQERAAFAPPAARRGARQAEAREGERTRAPSAPTINVTIGRVEVRATQAPAPAPRRAEAAPPRMSLDDYLRRRSGEVRE